MRKWMTHDPSSSFRANFPSTRRRVSITALSESLHISTMTPRPKSSHSNTSFKTRYSKKVPKQVYFPHKRKVVRRRITADRDGSEKRQMHFLPDEMKGKGVKVIMDSDEEDEEEDMEENIGKGAFATDFAQCKEQSIKKRMEGRGKKGDWDATQEEDGENKGFVRPSPRRRWNDTTSKQKRSSQQVVAKILDPHKSKRIEAERNMERKHTLKRQSTMTQLVYGRRPSSDTDEPTYNPVKPSPRLSWSGRGREKRRCKQQRTLTQMIPGMRPLENLSDEDMEDALSDLEEQKRESQEYGSIVTRRLAQQGLHWIGRHEIHNKATVEHQAAKGEQTLMGFEDNKLDQPLHLSAMPADILQSVEDMDEDDEDTYQPTQFIDAPITKIRRAPRQAHQQQQSSNLLAAESPKVCKSRFRLLSTPEKRHIREIPSSQSPAESLLSTQVSPQKACRSPLKECPGNTINALETPSKRNQVTFQEPTKLCIPPPALRRFSSTIQDSEDEDGTMIEEDIPSTGKRLRVCTSTFLHGVKNPLSGTIVGAYTQSILEQIDQVCANVDEDTAWLKRYPSEGRCDSTVHEGYCEPSLKLVERPEDAKVFQDSSIFKQSLNHTDHTTVKQKPLQDIEILDLDTVDQFQSHKQQPDVLYRPTSGRTKLTAPAEELASIPPSIRPYSQYTFPSTPMKIEDSSSDEESDSGSIPPSVSRQAPSLPAMADVQNFTDPDSEPIRVSRSPSLQHETQESHSSKAEEQLQNESFSYSQYINTRPPQSSSMNVARDTFSNNGAQMHPVPSALEVFPQPSGYHPNPSQATTVDEVTPRKDRTQYTITANVTPTGLASPQPFSTSPASPPPLVIPSSCMSSAKMCLESWSSPEPGKTQGNLRSSQLLASLENFSIPLPPPIEDD